MIKRGDKIRILVDLGDGLALPPGSILTVDSTTLNGYFFARGLYRNGYTSVPYVFGNSDENVIWEMETVV